jgi:hypothetical protein
MALNSTPVKRGIIALMRAPSDEQGCEDDKAAGETGDKNLFSSYFKAKAWIGCYCAHFGDGLLLSLRL